MNREEARELLLNISAYDVDNKNIVKQEAIELAIKALEQEPCGGCISRQAVTDCFKKWQPYMATRLFDFEKELSELPPVTPAEKVGWWVMPVQDDGMSDPIYYQVRCSECGFDLDPQTWHQELYQFGADKYCPKCGCLMKGGEL